MCIDTCVINNDDIYFRTEIIYIKREYIVWRDFFTSNHTIDASNKNIISMTLFIFVFKKIRIIL